MTDRATAIGVEIDTDPKASAVAWGAVLAGAFIAMAVTLACMVFGSGLGLTMVSPWWERNADATTIGIATIAFLVITQWVSSGLGGYIAGRLRTRWSVSADEVFFRDTAHGLLVWAVATVVVAGIAGQSLVGLVNAGAQAAGQVAGAASSAAQQATESLSDPTDYFVDTLFRPAAESDASEPAAVAPAPATAGQAAAPSVAPAPASPPTASSATGEPTADRADVRQETLRIIVRGMAADTFPEADRAYLGQLVAAETGMTQQEANARVEEVIQSLSEAKADAQAAAEQAREAAVTLAIVAFVSLLVGAFIGAVAGALGGSHRDDQSDTAIIR